MRANQMQHKTILLLIRRTGDDDGDSNDCDNSNMIQWHWHEYFDATSFYAHI